MTRFPFDAVLWDIDGTLADSEPVHERSFHDVFHALDLSLPDNFQDVLLGSSEDATHAWLVANCGLTLDLDAFVAQRQARYLDRIAEVTPHPDAQPIWQGLQARGVVQATVSNSARPLVDANLRQLGLLDQHLSLARDDVDRGKPAPDPYLKAAQTLDIAPDRIAVVEDSATGLASGHAAGMRVYMMPHFAGNSDAPWHPISDLAALLS